jgi:hypothetical protein
MFKYLVRRAPVHGVTHYIEARDFLFLVQKRVNTAPVDAAQGEGTPTSPWRLTTATQWLGCAKSLPKNTDNYLIAAGRLIKRGSDQYISDEGPAWRRGNAEAATKAFQGEAPTYREAAQNVMDPNKILPQADARRKAAGLAGAETWADTRKQPMLCRAIRAILKGKQLDLFVGGKVVKDYSRMQTALPVLTVAMFLAEPARNSRAFPINLMLLDLAEGRPGYTLDRILWHPHALHVNKREEWLDPKGTTPNPFWSGKHPVPGLVEGPASKTDRTIVTIARRGDLHLVGGIMPASPTGGGEFGKAVVPVAKYGPKPKFAPDFIHDKEASVVAKWLEWATFSTWQAATEVRNDWISSPLHRCRVHRAGEKRVRSYPERPEAV